MGDSVEEGSSTTSTISLSIQEKYGNSTPIGREQR